MKLDFIEIGTADFDTLIERCSDESFGISVEPIKLYLDRLPNKPNVKKVNAAIVDDKTLSSINTYYVHEDDINRYNLGSWLKGCNSVGKPHDFHIGYHPDPAVWHTSTDRESLPKRDLVSEGIVKCFSIDCLTYEDLIIQNNVEYVENIKIDTEGQDSKLINSIVDFYSKSKMDLPKSIMFETNAHNDPNEVNKVCKRLVDIGYKLNSWDGEKFDSLNNHNCIATL